MKLGLIYKATNLINGKIYIGKTINSLRKRMSEHKSKSFTKNDNFHFHNALRKYDLKNFKWEVLYDNIPENKIDLAEICAVYVNDSYYEGYNSTLGGETVSMLGHPVSEETKRKISISNIGKNKGKLPWNTGKHLSIWSREKISKTQKQRYAQNPHLKIGKPHSEETKKKISESRKGKVPWNKGLNIENDARLAVCGKKISDTKRKRGYDVNK